MKEPVDWIRAVFTGSVTGGLLWAMMAKASLILLREGISPYNVYLLICWPSASVLIVGGVLYSCSKGSFSRSTAIGVILAPLTGWSILLFITVVIALVSYGTH
jgi:hypothetical protein